MAYLLVMIAFGLATGFHEFGHFLAAKVVSVPVKEFSIGFGPGIKKQFGDTTYKIGVIPAGGFVRMADESTSTGWRHFVISLAGPLFSLLLGVGVCLLMTRGHSIETLAALADSVKSLFTDGSANLAGPIGIIKDGATMLEKGLAHFILFFGIVNFSIGILNLLPIPPLDGWSIFIGWWLPEAVNAVFLGIGTLALIGLLLFITYKDIRRAFFTPEAPAVTESEAS